MTITVDPTGKRILGLSAAFNKALVAWKKIDDFCDGDRDYLVANYLIPHISESQSAAPSPQLWQGRQDRSGYENDCQPNLDIHIGHMAQPINFGDALKNPRLSPIIHDATGFGKSAQELFAEKLELYLKHGIVATLVDGPKTIGASIADAIATGERSYQVLYKASQILEYSYFNTGPRKGQFKSVVLAADPIIVEEKTKDAIHWFHFEAGAEANEEMTFVKEMLIGDNNAQNGLIGVEQKYTYSLYGPVEKGTLKIIPIEITGRGLKDSKMRDVVSQNWKVFNSKSIRDNINYNQGFQWVLIFGADKIDLVSKSEFSATLISNPDAKVQVIDAGDPTGLEKQIEAEEDKLRKIARWEYGNTIAAGSGNIQSAESKAEDNKSKNKIYGKIIQLFQKSFNRDWVHHCLYENVNPPLQATLSTGFGLDDETAEQSTRTIQASRAKSIGADEIVKNIVKVDISEMKIIPNNGENVDQARQRLMDSVNNAEAPQPILGTSFGGKPKPSIAVKVNEEEKKIEEAAA